jgi:hypothetical protein
MWNSIHSLVVKYLPSKQGSWVRFPLDAIYLFCPICTQYLFLLFFSSERLLFLKTDAIMLRLDRAKATTMFYGHYFAKT